MCPCTNLEGLNASFSGWNPDPDILKPMHLAGKKNKHTFSNNLIRSALEVHDCHFLTILPFLKKTMLR